MRVYYTISKGKNGYIVWKNVEGEHSIGCKDKFHGTKDQCLKYCKENHIKISDEKEGN